MPKCMSEENMTHYMVILHKMKYFINKTTIWYQTVNSNEHGSFGTMAIRNRSDIIIKVTE